MFDDATHAGLKIFPWNYTLKTNPTPVFSAISPSKWQKTLKCTNFSMVERSPTVATSVATQASKLLFLKDTCWFIAERSLSIANNATTPVQQLVISKTTCGYIQGESLLAANSVTSLAHQPAPSRDMLNHSGEKSFNCAKCEYSGTRAGNLKIQIRTHWAQEKAQCKNKCMKKHGC